MEAYFSTKEMCHIFDVGRETLRHYENIGLLHPLINPENGYRNYEYWDVGAMIDILKYRSVGLSLKETGRAMFGSSFEDNVNLLNVQQEVCQEQMMHYKMLAKKISIDMDYINRVHNNFGVLYELEPRELYFVSCINPPPDKETEERLKKVFRNCQFFSTSWLFDENTPPASYWHGIGFSTEREFAEYLKIDGGVTLNTGRGVGGFLDIKGKEKICPLTFEEFNRDVYKKYPKASKETLGILLSRFTDQNGEYHQYIFVRKAID